MAYVKPVITNIYYEKPDWILSEVVCKDYICVSGESKESDVALFLTLLFRYNHIDEPTFEEAFKELLDRDGIVISGGVGFFSEDGTSILPSCCAGLEDIVEVCEAIRIQKSPWLGHDPTPFVSFSNDTVNVWSDQGTAQLEQIRDVVSFSYKQLTSSLEQCCHELQAFIEGPMYEWLQKMDKTIAEQAREKIKYWILETK